MPLEGEKVGNVAVDQNHKYMLKPLGEKLLGKDMAMSSNYHPQIPSLKRKKEGVPLMVQR